MNSDNSVTVVGYVIFAPELHTTQRGTSCTELSVAWHRRKSGGEDEPHFFDVACFGDLAKNVAHSVEKGDRVVVFGTLNHKRWKADDGTNRSRIKIYANDVAISLRGATVGDVTKTRKQPHGNDGVVHAGY